jgi:5'(3')-deoxyribonucleotidase
MSITTIAVDCDGVLTDFVGAVAEVYGLPDDFTPPDWEIWKYVGEANERDFWETIRCQGIEFWQYMLHYETAKLLIQGLNKYVNDNVFLCTTVVDDEYAYMGRVLWALNTGLKHKGIYFGDKSALANDSVLLIDDKVENCKDFIVKGGHALIYPRPWNGHDIEPEDALRHVLLKAGEVCRASGFTIGMFDK